MVGNKGGSQPGSAGDLQLPFRSSLLGKGSLSHRVGTLREMRQKRGRNEPGLRKNLALQIDYPLRTNWEGAAMGLACFQWDSEVCQRPCNPEASRQPAFTFSLETEAAKDTCAPLWLPPRLDLGEQGF